MVLCTTWQAELAVTSPAASRELRGQGRPGGSGQHRSPHHPQASSLAAPSACRIPETPPRPPRPRHRNMVRELSQPPQGESVLLPGCSYQSVPILSLAYDPPACLCANRADITFRVEILSGPPLVPAASETPLPPRNTSECKPTQESVKEFVGKLPSLLAPAP